MTRIKQFATIGADVPRLDGWEKVTGKAQYIGDIRTPGAWIGGTLRSPVARGRLRSIRKDDAFDWSKVVCLTAKDLPGPNSVSMVRDDLPILAADEIRFATQPLAIVAAPDSGTLAEALRRLYADIEELPPVLTMEDSVSLKEIVYPPDNIIMEYRIDCGDPDKGFSTSDSIIEGTYRTGYQEHIYLETQGVVANPLRDGGIDVFGSMQCPYYVHNALCKGLALPPEKVIVRQTVTGGAFGGKEDYPSVLALHASLLALKSGHPVRFTHDRKEDILCSTKRHPSLIRHRTGVMRNGTLVAADIDILLDGGAYTTMSIVVLQRAALHATGGYRFPNARIRARAVATNTPPNGAFRGFGVPQSIFAIERQMDAIAKKLEMDPLDVRLSNAMNEGDIFPFGQRLRQGVPVRDILERAATLSGYREKRLKCQNDCGEKRKGIGIALGVHGSGFTGSGEQKIAGTAKVRWNRDSTVDVLVSSVEMGQGASTVLPMIASEALGIPVSRIRHLLPDTSEVPNSGPTVASRTTMYVGRMVADACRNLLEKLTEYAAFGADAATPGLSVRDGCISDVSGNVLGAIEEIAQRFLNEKEELSGVSSFHPEYAAQWDDASFRGEAYKAYGWIATVSEVEVDRGTCEIVPLETTCVVDAGVAIHPVLAEGQVEGGALQALGWAYLEDLPCERGRYLTGHLNAYLIPTSQDAPKFTVEFVHNPSPDGPYGAKGLGELPMDAGAPSIASAVECATGAHPTAIPITGEVLYTLLNEGAGKKP